VAFVAVGFSDVHKNGWGVGTHRLALETLPVSWLGDDTGTCPLGYCRRRNIGSIPGSMNLEAIQIRLAVCRLDAGSDVPSWVDQSREFTSVTRTMDELSVVCARDDVPEGVPMEGPWRAFRVKGPIVMTLIGIVAALANPLAAAGIPIFAISTFDTDYILVHEPDFDAAVGALTQAGHVVLSS
jgi:hypothetical protein